MKKAHFYQITNISAANKECWWYPKKRKWSSSVVGPCSTSRYIKSAKVAWKAFHKMPKGFILIKIFKKNEKYPEISWEKI